MNSESVKIAKTEAKRFLSRVEDWENSHKKSVNEKGRSWNWEFPKQCGALKRSSMDLTRVLTEMRRPG